MSIDDRVRSYACDAVGACTRDRITALSRFQSGERHAVYKVSYLDPVGGTNDLVVRIAAGDDARDCTRAESEARALAKAQGFAAPVLHDFRCESPWFDAPTMCMQFVPGQQRELAAAAPEDVERLGSVVRWVHELPTDDLVEWFPETSTTWDYLHGRLDAIVGKLPAVRDPLPLSVQDRLRRASLVVTRGLRARDVDSFRSDEKLVLLHGDVAGGNIIWDDQKPVLIDWEYARLGDPADEIAYTFSQNALTTPQRNAFWRGYGRSTTTQRELEQLVDRVGWWEPLTLLGSVLWWIEQWSRRAEADAAGEVDPSAPKTQSYYLDHALRRLERLDESLNRDAGSKVF